MTNRPSLSLGYLGSFVLVAGMYACSAGDVSSPRTSGSNSNGNGGTSSNGNGGSFSGNGGSGNAPLGNGGSFSGNGGSGNAPLGNGGTVSSGSGGASSNGNGGTSGAGGTTGNGGGFNGSGGAGTGSGGSAGGFVGAGGTSSAGTGGTSAAGVGGAAGAGGGPPLSNDSMFAMAGFGMITAGAATWQGYLYTATYGTGSIMPVCPTPCFMSAAKQLCVNGNVPMDPTYGSGALLGWNINQPMGTTTAGTVALAGTGVTLTFAGTVDGFHVSLLDGAATPTEYCYVIPAASGATVSIPFANFKTNCSDPSKTMTALAAGTLIQKMQITVQSTPSMAAPFNFCLVNVAVN